MAVAATMRELTVSSPAVAYSLSSGQRMDENQNSALLKDAQNRQGSEPMYNGKSVDPYADSSSDDVRDNTSSSPSAGEYVIKRSPGLSRDAKRSMTQQGRRPAGSNSPDSDEATTISPELEDSTVKFLRSARRISRRDDVPLVLSTPDAESTPRRKHRSVNNNESIEEDPQCPICGSEFSSWPIMINHLKVVHPDQDLACVLCHIIFESASDFESHRNRVHNSETKRKKAPFESPKLRIDRKQLRNIPKVIGFQDINFIDFSSEKFPLVAKDICEKRLHLSKDEFCFECRLCGRGFPCSSALEIHARACDQKTGGKEVIKKNKRKSTPQFRPRAVPSESEESEIEVDMHDKRRNDFFNSLHLRNNEAHKPSSLKSSEDESERQKIKVCSETRDHRDLADIESMISVTNIPGISMKSFQLPSMKPKREERSQGLNIQIENSQASPKSLSTVGVASPSFTVLSLISPNQTASDYNEEEAQDCFAAECRKMKLRGEFPCKLCTQVFPNLRALKGHNRIHVSGASGTPMSPYRCNICPYSSMDKATLVRHMRSHNGDRPYECAMCNYAFTTKANCERHLRNRHSKMTRDDVKSSIIYHPSEDPINDSDYLKTSELNKKNIEKTKELKQDYALPMNLKINLAVLNDRQRSDYLFQDEHQQLLDSIGNKNANDQPKMEVGTMTEEVSAKHELSPMEEPWSGEEALDLRVNKYKYDTPPSECSDGPEDLTRKDLKEFNNNIDINKNDTELSSFPSPPFEPKRPDISTLVKMYSAMYPSLSMAQVHQIILTQLNFPGLFQSLSYPPFLMSPGVYSSPTFAKNAPPKDAVGLQLSGGSIMDESKASSTATNKMQYFQQEALAKIMINREKDRLANDFYNKQSSEQPAKPRVFNEYFTETDKKAFQDILINREIETKAVFPTTKTVEQPSEMKSASVKMVIKNGVLMPKQKQRRYRTERPFSCDHCSARFTLRSNMERHIKQQHPRFWTQKSRYNVGQGKKSETRPGLDDLYNSQEATSSQSRGEVSSTAGDINWEMSKSSPKSFKNDHKSDDSDGDEPREMSDEEESKDDLIIDEENGNDHLRLLANVTEYLKSKQDSQSERLSEPLKEPQPQDLASVSKMLDNAVTQTQAFQKYFQDGVRKEEDEARREEGERSEEEEGLVAGSTSSDENRSESEVTSKVVKKKSAYSLAPNRVSCPYCLRKFPWTSSLRRHVLTHTGQKPFKCTHCPLLFTTKSNCDRHLLRKHGRDALLASSGQTENHEGAATNSTATNSAATSPSNASQQSQGASNLRNVPERPYKCNHCPASTFSSLSNLTKHMSNKHHEDQIMSPERVSSPDHTRVKNNNPLAPPNVTISPTFPINIPKALSIIPQYTTDVKPRRFPINVPSIKVQEWGSTAHNGECEEEGRSFRKRSSSDETDASERKRSSPDFLKISPVQESHSDNEAGRGGELPPIPANELPFKCHLCEGSFGERSEALDHIRLHHAVEFQLLMSKGALETTSEEDRVPHDDHDDIEHSRGRFPDYAHRKVMCAFCMRRFWSAEDLRRHMRTHTGERPFSCDVCQRKFTLKHSMLRHRKKHSAHDEHLIGSDEEHHNVVGSTTPSSQRSDGETSGGQPKTILHQTLTRKDEDKNKYYEVTS